MDKTARTWTERRAAAPPFCPRRKRKARSSFQTRRLLCRLSRGLRRENVLRGAEKRDGKDGYAGASRHATGQARAAVYGGDAQNVFSEAAHWRGVHRMRKGFS